MKYFLFLLLFAMHITAFSQIMGTTDDGKRVKLNSNGTWEYKRHYSIRMLHGQKPAEELRKRYAGTTEWTCQGKIAI